MLSTCVDQTAYAETALGYPQNSAQTDPALLTEADFELPPPMSEVSSAVAGVAANQDTEVSSFIVSYFVLYFFAC